MFAIKIGSRFVVLDSESTLSLEINNPLFETELLPGDWTLPFTVPDHPTNNIIFNLPKDISNTAEFEQDYDAELYIGGNLYSLGRINVTRAEPGRYSLVFGNEISRLKATLENKKLNEFDYGGVRTFGTTSDDIIAHAKDTVLADPLDYDYVFPSIYAPFFYGDSQQNNPYTLLFLNSYDAPGAAFKKNVVVTTESAANKYTLAPQPYLHYLLNQLFAAAGFILKGGFMDDAEMKKLLVYSNYSLDKKNAVTHNSKAILDTPFSDDEAFVVFDNDSTDGGTDPDNDYNTATGEYTIPEVGYYSIDVSLLFTPQTGPWSLNPAWRKLHLYKDGVLLETYTFNGTYLLESAQHTFTGYFTGADVGKKIKVKYTIGYGPNPSSLTPLSVDVLADSYADFTVIAQSELNKFSNDIDIVNHVPDMQATDFLVAIFSFLQIKMKPIKGTNVIELNYATDIINSTTYNNLTPIARPVPTIEKEKPTGTKYNFDFPSSDFDTKNNFKSQTGKEQLTDVLSTLDLPAVKPNTFIRIGNTNMIYIASFNEGTGLYEWVYATDNYFELIKTDGLTELKPALSPLIMRDVEMLGANIIAPQATNEGTSLAFANGLKPQPKLRLMFYHGMCPDENGDNYPYASATRYDYEGNEVGTINLQWDGTDGIYDLFHKPLFDFMQTARMVTHTIDFTTAHLGTIDVFEKQLIHHMYYFISRIRVNLKPNGIEPATVETYSIQ